MPGSPFLSLFWYATLCTGVYSTVELSGLGRNGRKSLSDLFQDGS